MTCRLKAELRQWLRFSCVPVLSRRDMAVCLNVVATGPGYLMIKKAAAARSPEELVALLSAVSSAILAVIIVATLYFGREIFVPVALAILLSFVLAPVVNLLQRIRIPRAVAVVSVVALAFATIFGLG